MGRGLRQLRRRDDRGSTMPAFLGLVWVTLIMGVVFLQFGRATDLSAEAQTGADAASLAAGEDLRNQIIEYLMSGAHGPFVPNYPRAEAAARAFAARNDVHLDHIAFRQLGYFTFDIDVRTRTQRQLTPLGSAHTDPETGERVEFAVGSGEQAEQEATARVRPGAGSFLLGAGAGGGGGGSGVADTSSGACPISDGELAALADAAGVPGDFARTSALARYSDCDGGRAVRPLQEAMKISILRLEHAMGQPLQINSAYRSPAYQRDLCQRVAGPCAPPGASLHNFGLAIDVQNWQAAAAAVSQDPDIGLCQPLPVNDAVHFSHVTGRECGGRTGASNGGVPGGQGSPPIFGGFGQAVAQAGIVVGLVD